MGKSHLVNSPKECFWGRQLSDLDRDPVSLWKFNDISSEVVRLERAE
jgi:hypothetical protein